MVCSRIIRRDARCVGSSLADEVWLNGSPWRLSSSRAIHCIVYTAIAADRKLYIDPFAISCTLNVIPVYVHYALPIGRSLFALVNRSLIKKVRPREMAWHVWRTWENVPKLLNYLLGKKLARNRDHVMQSGTQRAFVFCDPLFSRLRLYYTERC